MSRYRQIVTLAIDFDPAICPPPESWDWAALFEGQAELLASGAARRIDDEATPLQAG